MAPMGPWGSSVPCVFSVNSVTFAPFNPSRKQFIISHLCFICCCLCFVSCHLCFVWFSILVYVCCCHWPCNNAEIFPFLRSTSVSNPISLNVRIGFFSVMSVVMVLCSVSCIMSCKMSFWYHDQCLHFSEVRGLLLFTGFQKSKSNIQRAFV